METIAIEERRDVPATPALVVDDQRLEAFVGQTIGDVGGAFGVLLAYIGDQTGVYRELHRLGRAGPAELAEASGVDERYLLEWLSAQAAGGYINYHDSDGTFSLAPEQAAVLAVEGHPASMQGLFQQVVSQATTHERAIEVFRSGAGRGWEDHHACCFCGTDRFFGPGYAANLVDAWLPALDGVLDKLIAGARVADVGCGHGSSTTLMARAFPASTFHGIDFHAPSIEVARAAALTSGVAGNTRFTQASAADMPRENFDLVCIFDALHDMGDPVGAARSIRESLHPDGTFMVVEPMAGDDLSDNLNNLGQIIYAASTLICTPASRDQEVGLALGAQAGERRLTAVLREAGFTRIRRATETPTNMVLEARP